MQFIKPGTSLDFVGKRKIAYSISGALILISIIALVVKGPRYGVDFAGGSVIQVKFAAPVEIAKIKDGLRSLDVENATVQSIGAQKDNEYLIRTDSANVSAKEFTPALDKALEAAASAQVDIRRVEMVGPQVGMDLREKAMLAIFFSLIFIAIYISGRFEFKWLQSGIVALALGGGVYAAYSIGLSLDILIWVALGVTLTLFWILGLKYALGAIVALIHDVTITVGIMTLMDKEFTLTVIAALLTIIGYSLNDTIIVYDRIRENIKKLSKTPLGIIINRSVNETLSRTILTAGTVFIVLVALFFLGGDIIHDFAFALLVGVVVGTYSSIYVASPIVLSWEERAKKK
ncbi:MAG: protein translocase subunit SecF [Hyphomicrobiales bacterium]